MKRTIIILLGAALSACLWFSCGTMNIAGGGNSSGTGNGAIVCAASDRIDGVTRPKAKVDLYSEDWMPVLDTGTYSGSSAADDSGKFVFTNVPQGYYNLIIFSAGEQTAGIFVNIPCQPTVTWADTIDTLKKPGYLHGFLTSARNDTLALSYIYVRGTSFHAMTDTHGEFLMGALPAAHFTMQVYGLFTTSANGPMAIPNTTTPNESIGGVLTDTIPATIYPDSITQLTR
jgi:hypothetical protein